MKPTIIMRIFKKLSTYIKKMFTHNHCDTCGYTKDKVYVTEFYCEAGLIQCLKCKNK